MYKYEDVCPCFDCAVCTLSDLAIQNITIMDMEPVMNPTTAMVRRTYLFL